MQSSRYCIFILMRVWLSEGICGDASGSAEQFCQIVFDCVCMLCQGSFYQEYVCGTSAKKCLCCLHVGVPVLS